MARKPRSELNAIGKNPDKAPYAIFDCIPTPNHRMNSG